MTEIDDLHVSLIIGSDGLDPSSISDLVGLVPSRVHAKGDPHPTSTLPDLKWHRSVWLLESGALPGARLDDHLRAILRQLEGKEAELAALRAAGWHTELRCGIFLDDENEGTLIASENIIGLAKLGVDLGLDIYAGDAEANAALTENNY